ncbi:hypothetical protein GLYMA_18G242701v4 [Glycine max]|nr:hypothetical protein GLYMA_18G242701v4 [Glycine max]KAH1155957.1 hypothetical protein GYH30_050978 [Glycine max]
MWIFTQSWLGSVWFALSDGPKQQPLQVYGINETLSNCNSTGYWVSTCWLFVFI